MSIHFGQLISSCSKLCTVSRVLSLNYVRYNVTRLITYRWRVMSNTIQSRLRIIRNCRNQQTNSYSDVMFIHVITRNYDLQREYAPVACACCKLKHTDESRIFQFNYRIKSNKFIFNVNLQFFV